MDKVIERIRQSASAHRSDLDELLRVPSISSNPENKADMETAAKWLLTRMQKLGIRSEIIPTPGHSIVYGEHLQAEGAPTILVYGHYDVQPVDPLELWDTPPFEPSERDGAVFARGSSDDKGQLLIHLFAAQEILAETGGLPVNLKFLLEGEEEVGSPNLKPFIEANIDKLACDAVVVSDTSFFSRDVPSMLYGLRGLSYVEVIVRGPDRDLHSGEFGGAVANPADVLARMIAALHDEDRRIAIPGFYDKVRELEGREREAFASLPHNEAAYKKDLDVEALEGEEGFTTLERLWARPTLEVNGIWGGFSGEGAKTVLPAEAGAKISCRLVPDQNPDEVSDLLEKRLRELAPASVSLEFIRHHGGNPFLAEPDNTFVKAGARAINKAFGKMPVLVRGGGSVPVTETFQSMLGVPCVMMGVGLPDDRLHSPNEKFDLEQFHKGIEAAAWFLHEAGKVK
jgi:acetylornithine deacetylase/succinyl-diaminopimelate desuccinylase-like protein